MDSTPSLSRAAPIGALRLLQVKESGPAGGGVGARRDYDGFVFSQGRHTAMPMSAASAAMSATPFLSGGIGASTGGGGEAGGDGRSVGSSAGDVIPGAGASPCGG